MENSSQNKDYIKTLIPSTLEGCVVRICDMVAYLGKDRQDAKKAKLIESSDIFTQGEIGVENAEIINNMIVNIVENSYRKDYIMLDSKYYDAMNRFISTKNWTVFILKMWLRCSGKSMKSYMRI